MESIALFMWGYQRHFQISLRRKAEELFQALDPDFEVEAFLVGIRRNDAEEDQPICLEPEECGFIPTDFQQVRQDTEQFLEVHPDRNLLTTHPSHQRTIEKRTRDSSEKSAVMKALTKNNGSSSAGIFFSGFMPVGNYDVGTVLLLTHKNHVVHCRLPLVHAYEQFAVPRSLLDGAVDTFLRCCRKSLHVPNPENVDSWEGPNVDEILRAAGNRLMEAPVHAAAGFDGLGGLFNACNYIASLTYESAGTQGELIVARPEHPNIKRSLTLLNPVSLQNHRAIRKLLEISAAGDALISDGGSVAGFGTVVGTYMESSGDLLRVKFTGHHKWELWHADHQMMRVLFGKCSLPLPSLNPFRFAEDIERIFPKIAKREIENLFKLAEEAGRQRHGTVLLITSDAAPEVLRLSSQATPITPIPMTPEMIRSVTAIDGAVMLDPDGVCHGIGVILDGEATNHGNPSRGARYNSSVRYIVRLDAKGQRGLAVIVSEDGTVDWFPQLPPRVSRKLLKMKDAEADAVLMLEDLPVSRSSRLLKWLDGHRFYLERQLCDKANLIEQKRLDKLAAAGAVYFRYKKFEPNCEPLEDFLKE